MLNNSGVIFAPCDQVGTLALVGVYKQTVTFVAADLQILDMDVFKRRMAEEFLVSIVTKPAGSNCVEYNTTAIFQCSFEGQLRNPKGFLKCARNRLHKVIKDSEQEFWKRISDEDTEIDDDLEELNFLHSFELAED